MNYCDRCGEKKGYSTQCRDHHLALRITGKCDICSKSTICTFLPNSVLPQVREKLEVTKVYDSDTYWQEAETKFNRRQTAKKVSMRFIGVALVLFQVGNTFFFTGVHLILIPFLILNVLCGVFIWRSTEHL